MSIDGAFVQDGDLGSGKPGSSAWHRVHVAQMTDRQIIQHLKEAFDMTVQDIAQEIIDGHST